jgi:hypothetical protein
MPRHEKLPRHAGKLPLFFAHLLGDLGEESGGFATAGCEVPHDAVDEQLNLAQWICFLFHERLKERQVTIPGIFDGLACEILLAAEVKVEISPLHPGRSANIVYGCAGVPLIAQEALGCVDDLLSGGSTASIHAGLWVTDLLVYSRSHPPSASTPFFTPHCETRRELSAPFHKYGRVLALALFRERRV